MRRCCGVSVESSVNLTCVTLHGNPSRDEIGVEIIFERL